MTGVFYVHGRAQDGGEWLQPIDAADRTETIAAFMRGWPESSIVQVYHRHDLAGAEDLYEADIVERAAVALFEYRREKLRDHAARSRELGHPAPPDGAFPKWEALTDAQREENRREARAVLGVVASMGGYERRRSR